MRHYRITFNDAMEAHAAALQLGGSAGLVSEHLIHSAIGRPYNGHYRAIFSKAAALTQSVVGNHAFVDGNKRTAVMLLTLLLSRSGYEFKDADSDQFQADLEQFIVELAAGHHSFESARAWIKARIVQVA